ncbi:UDP-2,3-diacylglucosamine pyrophosphatase LpxH [Sporobacter termitidis DSM 10068]|uniref:UDP-2,3-diacylglucosamine pyrophosphatase LpxH n=1 Tax=Sporobacter termitidis DSM 10068 TaxID=1123282 RepID=A0A1M5VQ50_9FIRM|nr:metallophosphoesterase [Sporobacter termitidis]SHH77411.1 UDP-2,3-diacylglucosamine pyrophosphatase LpxH [Sporobacter termitidis DSM 10068]
MSTYSRLCQVFSAAPVIEIDEGSKIVVMSDCHRGDGSWIDNFSHNHNIYYAALRYYFDNGFTYIENGDGDELWKFRSLHDISSIYIDIFRLLHRFYHERRLYMIYGNHDIEKKDPDFVRKNMAAFYDNHADRYEPLFENITAYEGLVLKHRPTGRELFVVHGHQGDPRDDRFWKTGKFFVRHFWRRMELLGFKDITSAAKNNVKKKHVEKRLYDWAAKNGRFLIAGHTHRPSCPLDQDNLYFNDGSCVHPTSITALEIENSEITLVKWSVKTTGDLRLYVNRQEIAVRRKIL